MPRTRASLAVSHTQVLRRLGSPRHSKFTLHDGYVVMDMPNDYPRKPNYPDLTREPMCTVAYAVVKM